VAKVRAHILVVDDEEILLDLVSEVLEDHGFGVTALTSAPDARDVFLGRPSAFDLVVADEKMPELSGTDLAKEILAIRPDIPIILYTDYPEVSSAKRAKAIGVRMILPKSARTEELVLCIRRVLES
jgi:two-component system, cell cycle sensor histidine kinase and response regulator CckA